MKHTPGPWYVNGDTFDVERMDGTFGNTKRIIARCATGEGAMSNAVLIAAAPDLLKALKTVRANLIRLAWEENSIMIEGIDEAINKAEGQS